MVLARQSQIEASKDRDPNNQKTDHFWGWSRGHSLDRGMRNRIKRSRGSFFRGTISMWQSCSKPFAACFQLGLMLAMLPPLFLAAELPIRESCGYIFDAYPPLYYPVSMHSLIGVSALGDSVELEDGSVWKISRYDGYKALGWRSNDPLTITQNHRWFSIYAYRIINQNTGACLEANLFLGPLEHGQHTLYITGIDRISGDLVVTNGSGESIRWEISSSDIAAFQNWDLHDAIIIGQNSGWNTDCESLLINFNMNNSARAKQN